MFATNRVSLQWITEEAANKEEQQQPEQTVVLRPDEVCPSSEHCTLAFCGCTTARYRVNTAAPDVLLVLDRSDSMNEPVDGVSKWDIARVAINELVSSYQDLLLSAIP